VRANLQLAEGNMIPDFLTRADWDVPVEAAAAVVKDAGGINFGVDDVEKLLNAAERFEAGFMRVGNKIMEMRDFEANGGRSNVVDPPADGVHHQQNVPSAEIPNKTIDVGGSGQITADKVYNVLLGALNMAAKTYPDKTTPELLVLARQAKSLIMPEIEAQLIKMATPE